MISRVTNREIEVKLAAPDIPQMVDRLRSLHAVLHGRVFEQNTLYDTPDALLRRHGHLLRVRNATPAASSFAPAGPGYTLLTSKAPPPPEHGAARSRFKERLERELVIEDPRLWAETLRALGFRCGFRYEKFRTSFRLPNLHLDLDETPLGAFLELEGAAKAIDRVSRALGYSTHDYLRSSYWDVYAAACRRLGRLPRNMVFERNKIAK